MRFLNIVELYNTTVVLLYCCITMLVYCRNLEGALNEFHPDLIVYNAGTDILEEDPLGCLSITAEVICT